MNDLTVEQLVAQGLTQAEAEAILGVTNEEQGGGSYPFPKWQINTDPDNGTVGGYGLNPQKDENGIISFDKVTGKEFTLRILVTYHQYTGWDASKNKMIPSSDIKKTIAKKSEFIDRVSGKDIASLKSVSEAEDKRIKYNMIALVEIDGEVGIVNWRGATVWALGEAFKQRTNGGKLNTVFTIKNIKKQNGSVIYYVPEIVNVEDFDMMKTLKSDGSAISKMNNWVDSYNGASVQTATQEVPEIDIDEEEVLF